MPKTIIRDVVFPFSTPRSVLSTLVQACQSRLPMLAWPRELPIDGEPADVVATVNDYGAWLARSPIPKLFIAGDPGAMLIGPARDFCEGWPRQQKVTVPGIHYLQEDSPTEIGVATARFIKDLPE